MILTRFFFLFFFFLQMNIKNDRNTAWLKLGALKTKTSIITAQPYTCKKKKKMIEQVSKYKPIEMCLDVPKMK